MDRIVIALLLTGWASCGLDQTAAAMAQSKTSPQIAPEHLNVESFGAKGDGNTDNSAALVTAIKASCDSGRPLLIPVGTFAFTSPINVSCPTLSSAEPRGTLHVSDTPAKKRRRRLL